MISLSSTSRMTTGSSRSPDLHRRLIAALAGDDLKAVAALPHDQRLDDPLLGDGGHQLGQVAHDLARLVGVRLDAIDGDQAADRRAGGGRQGLHVMLVMPHPHRFGEPSSRHDR